MRDFPQWIRLPVADWIEAAMNWILTNLGGVFDWIGSVGLRVLIAVEQLLLFLPWWAMILGVGLLAWYAIRRVRAAVALMVMLFLVGAFGYWTHAMNTLSVVIVSVAISIALGVPLGIVMAWSNPVRNIITPILDAMQTMPSFVYLIPALMLFGLGRVPATFATIIYAIPPVIRLTNVGIREVSPSVIEASTAFGANRWNLLFDVQLPLARPSIMVGINQTTMMALAMVVIGSMIGNRGLGMEVLLAINRVNIGQGFEAGISIVFLAIIIDRITNAFAKEKRVVLVTTGDAGDGAETEAEKSTPA
jgi:glycine betaine/proline transport system permease protein